MTELTPTERVYQVVAAIPPGRVATYGQVAQLAEVPNGARLVGTTLSNLPRGSKLPWHRVLNAQGRSSLSPQGAKRQLRLLREEGVLAINGRVDLQRYRL